MCFWSPECVVHLSCCNETLTSSARISLIRRCLFVTSHLAKAAGGAVSRWRRERGSLGTVKELVLFHGIVFHPCVSSLQTPLGQKTCFALLGFPELEGAGNRIQGWWVLLAGLARETPRACVVNLRRGFSPVTASCLAVQTKLCL